VIQNKFNQPLQFNILNRNNFILFYSVRFLVKHMFRAQLCCSRWLFVVLGWLHFFVLSLFFWLKFC